MRLLPSKNKEKKLEMDRLLITTSIVIICVNSVDAFVALGGGADQGGYVSKTALI